jgi:SAM-dependent methyltransferase
VEVEVWPYPSNEFDVVFSKSLIEHLSDPLSYLEEARRVLKPGGLLITMVPDWQANFKTYFDDFTHRTPFTKVSLNDAYLMGGFKDVVVIKFRQLPVVWKYPVINIFCALISPFVPVRTKIKFLRWSRELMLIGSGRKPNGS